MWLLCIDWQVMASLGHTLLLKMIDLEKIIARTPVSDVERCRANLALLNDFVRSLEALKHHQLAMTVPLVSATAAAAPPSAPSSSQQ